MTVPTQPITVELIGHYGDDLLVVNAARASFGKRKTVLDEKDEGLIRYLATGYRASEWRDVVDDMTIQGKKYREVLDPHIWQDIEDFLKGVIRKPQHWLPFAHPHATVHITVPVFLARQLVKHQIGGVWSEESRRYINDEPVYWLPHEWRTRPDDIKQGCAGPIERQDDAMLLAKTSYAGSTHDYKRLLAMGVAPEEARAVLPLAHMTSVVWTGSLAFWARVYNQRADSGAQTAARGFARMLGSVMEPLYPLSWVALTQ